MFSTTLLAPSQYVLLTMSTHPGGGDAGGGDGGGSGGGGADGGATYTHALLSPLLKLQPAPDPNRLSGSFMTPPSISTAQKMFSVSPWQKFPAQTAQKLITR